MAVISSRIGRLAGSRGPINSPYFNLPTRTPDICCTRLMSSDEKQKKTGRSPSNSKPKAAPSLTQLQSLLSKMKVASPDDPVSKKLSTFGNSDLFNYATSKQYERRDLNTRDLEVWNLYYRDSLEKSFITTPLNGFEEMIRLTEEGKLWKFPIDNFQGMDEEKNTPFEDHVLLDNYLQEFPQIDYIQQFMGFVLSGLAANPWMTVARKREIIKFYKDYFEDKKDLYKESGLNLE